MENISNEAQGWGQKVAQAASSHGYLHTAERRYSAVPICCICCPDDPDGKAGLLVPALLMGIAFFVGLFYTGKSINQAITYDRWRAEGNEHFLPSTPEPPPPYGEEGEAFRATRAAPQSGEVLLPSEPHPDEAIYREGIALLTHMCSERRWTSLGRALLTLGVGALTVAFLVTVIAEGRIGDPRMLLYGGLGSMGGGFVVLSGTQCYLRDKAQYGAIQRLQQLTQTS